MLVVACVVGATVLGGWAQAAAPLDLARHRRAALTRTILRIRHPHSYLLVSCG
ncbi:MAG: hypothetical protein ABI635_01510 [Actinomycetota bacterium]